MLPNLRRRGPPGRAGRCPPVDGPQARLRDDQRGGHAPPIGTLPPHGHPPLCVRLVVQCLWARHAAASRGNRHARPAQPIRANQTPERAMGPPLRPPPRPALPRPAVLLGVG